MTLFNLLEGHCARLPETLANSTANALHQWCEANPEFSATPDFAQAMVKVWACSAFVAENCQRQPLLLTDLYHSGDLSGCYQPQTYADKLATLQPDSEAHLMLMLRQFRKREMIRIAWRDLAGWASLDETLLDLSHLADACIQMALAYLYQHACAKRGTPLLADGSPQQIVVLGMGKLGADELNYSSDIDLIFAYPEDGVLPDRKATSYGEFFTKLCQSLIRVLDETTVDGFVFRTDIRLRPYGDSGAVIMTFDGMEAYYQTQAREWERYAMIKARQVAGDFKSGAQLMKMLQAFVYRRYLDYGAFAELRGLKAQISQELRRKDRMDNIKLGPGGIREVEFIGQAFQLIRGGQEKKLQTRGILDVLSRLGELGLMSADDVLQLQQSYRFLRRTENHIQQYQDRQTHDLPTDAKVRQILAWAMDYPDWDAFLVDLDTVRAQVHSVFDQVFSVSKQDQHNPVCENLWIGAGDGQELLQSCQQLGFCQPADSLMALRHFKQSPAIRRLSAKGAAVLDRLMPQLLEALRQASNPDETLKRILDLFEAVAGRNVYLALLAENSGALAQLVRLCAASPWLSGYLALHPVLFDDLLDPRHLYEPLNRADLDERLAHLLAPIDTQDEEALMFALRQFKQSQVLKVAAADIMGVIPLMVVSDYLSYIAESIVNQVVLRSWLLLTAKHGQPPGRSLQNMGFAVLGFGKLGGLELGYGSDLDLVFVYDYGDGNILTDGGKPIACSQFYGRLGLKVRHMMDTKLLSGILYEVDMRLRPSGDSGLLVAHIQAYENYQHNNAWTWEHQALVRGRFIAGDNDLQAAFSQIRHSILSKRREIGTLRAEVRDMREKMRVAFASKEAGQFDLKHSKGGIADIEFMVQFMVLAHAAQYPELTAFTDNVRILADLAKVGLLSEQIAKTLTDAYCNYRDLGHKQVLQGSRAQVDETQVLGFKTAVGDIWDRLMTEG
ncbi:bifunctional [glutamate--ammonia ligase]-adenylyl-L-tyrosine phosphorylase/[glutamate--ammonia-ligase] adenylyltransferase [Methylosoma difficile]